MSFQTLSPAPVFSDAGAQNNTVVVREAQEWIQVYYLLVELAGATTCGFIATTSLSHSLCVETVVNFV